MKELVVISGKGGTGKTSIVAGFAALAKDNLVLADCDVDAADLHLVCEPKIRERYDFSGGFRATIRGADCIGCRKCEQTCRFQAIALTGPGNDVVQKTCVVDPIACEGCGVCLLVCPVSTIEFGPVVNGEWYVSQTRFGPMVHAKLGIAQENSGKLVNLVRSKAKDVAQKEEKPLVLIDGSPGIGCPVIASVTGASAALVVTEPTLSGLHDLERVSQLTRHFGVPTLVCINKWDINPELTHRIETQARAMGLSLAGKVRYDPAVTQAQIKKKTVVECSPTGGSEDIQVVWTNISSVLTFMP
jgi:MinD superfamily P-loop ATPase